MESSLLTLKLMLDEVGIENDITDVDDRKKIQKAIYLVQRAGVDLGYRFSWYLMGPYSPRLTRDYYRLAEEQAPGTRRTDSRQLKPEARRLIGRIKPIMKPKTPGLQQDDWLELLASYHFLRTVRGETDTDSAETLRKSKPRLYPFRSAAKAALKSVGLL